MNIPRMFANAIARRVAYVLVALVVAALGSLLGMGQARAADMHPDRESAFAHCMSQASEYSSAINGPPWNKDSTPFCQKHVSRPEYRACVTVEGQQCNEQWYPGGDRDHRWPGPDCPAGGEWSESLKRCFDPEECLARNGAQNGMPLDPVAKPFRDKCVAGCSLSMQSGTGSCTVINFAGQTQTHCNGVFQYTGNTCDATPPDDDDGPEPDQDSCTPTGPNSGTKFCKKKDGRECFESNSGAMICWGTGETGQRTTGADSQTRGAGSDEPQPDPPTPPETFDPSKKGDPTTTTTTTEHPNGSTTTTTTTVINNSTTNGTNPPGTPGSNPGQGGGGSGAGDSEDGKDGTASGGGDCDTPPVTTGDAVTGMVATQAWATRCAVEAGNSASVTGDVGNCSEAFSVEGDNANAHQLRALRASICGPEETQRHDVETMGGFVDDLDAANAAGEAEFGESVVIESGELPEISLTRFGGGGGCPILSFTMPWGASWSPPAAFCDVIAALRLLFLAIATIWAVRIIGEQ